MSSSPVERLGSRLASSLILQSSRITRPWICADCRNTSRRLRRASHADAAPIPARFPNYLDEDFHDDRNVKGRRDAFIESLVKTTAAIRISELANPANWPAVQWQYMSPFRDFLEARSDPETRAKSRLDEHDAYGISHCLRQKHPINLIAALGRAAEDPDYLRSIPKTTWTEIMRTVSPQMLLQKLHRIHRSSSNKDIAEAGYDHDLKMTVYMRELSKIIDVRRYYGIDIDIVDYQILLSYTAMVGNLEAARKLWADMRNDGVKPDRICYNRYLETIVWDEQDRLRQAKSAKDTFPRIEAKVTNMALMQPGASLEISQLHNEMLANNISGDVSTYCVLLTALARDGQFEAAVNIITKVFRIDVKALMAGRDVSDLTALEPEGSPLFPSPRLLVTIADVYGIVNRLPAGFRVVDYIARQYNLTIKNHVWYQLLRWTFLQAGLKEKHRSIPENGSQLDIEIVRTLLATMQAEPYNAKMNMDLYYLSFQTFMRCPNAYAHSEFNPDDALHTMTAARKEYLKVLEEHQKMKMQRSDWLQTKPQWNSRTQSANDRLRHAEETARVKKFRYRQYLQRWTKQMLQLPKTWGPKLDHTEGPISETLTTWRVRGIPNLLGKWGSFAPSQLQYSTDTGIVSLVFRSAQEELKNKLQKAAHRRDSLSMKLIQRRRNELRKATTNRANLGRGLRYARALDLGAKHVHLGLTPDVELD